LYAGFCWFLQRKHMKNPNDQMTMIQIHLFMVQKVKFLMSKKYISKKTPRKP
jgi:hypothetical protein